MARAILNIIVVNAWEQSGWGRGAAECTGNYGVHLVGA